MKRLFLYLVLFSTAIACKKSKNDGPGNCKISTMVHKHANGALTTYNFEYDGNGRMKKTSYSTVKLEYEYSANGNYLVTTNFGNGTISRARFELNEAGLLKKQDRS